MLGACGFADSRAPSILPDAMRGPAAPERTADAEPDVKALVRDNLAKAFASPPRSVQVARPMRDPNGLGWLACVRAEVTAATGRNILTQTYLFSFNRGAITDRRLVGSESNCVSATYEPI